MKTDARVVRNLYNVIVILQRYGLNTSNCEIASIFFYFLEQKKERESRSLLNSLLLRFLEYFFLFL